MRQIYIPPEVRLRLNQAFAQQAALIKTETSLDVITLRLHVLLEVALQDLLGARLGVNAGDLPDLTFAKLSQLALSATGPELYGMVRDFNKIRNYVAHHLAAHELDNRIGDYLKEYPQLEMDWAVVTQKPRAWASVLLSIVKAVSMISALLLHSREMKDTSTYIDEPTLTRFMAESGFAMYHLKRAIAEMPAADGDVRA